MVNSQRNENSQFPFTIYYSRFTGFGQTPDLPATHARVATVAPFPAWRGSPALRCAEPEV